MNCREIWVIFHKELLDSLRDKRTWYYSILLPLFLVPLLVVVTSMGVSSQNKVLTEERVPLAVVGLKHSPALIDFFQAGNGFQIISVMDGPKALSDRIAKVSLVIPPGFDDTVLLGKHPELRIYFDSTDTRAMLLKERLIESLQIFTQALVEARLKQQGMNVGMLQPFALAVSDVAPDVQKHVGLLALMLPMLLIVWGATGGIHVAVDVTVGEKERGTLETLLATPASRLSLVIGKYLAVLLSAFSAQTASLVGFAVSFHYKSFFAEETVTGGLSLTWRTTIGLLLATVVLAAFFAAVEIALCLRSRTVREAQSYQAAISFSAMLPWLLVAFTTPADLPEHLFYVPLLNSVALFKELILGIFLPGHLIWTVVTCGVLAWLALRWAARRFQREEVLFRGI